MLLNCLITESAKFITQRLSV